jgi:hypothetical protein
MFRKLTAPALIVLVVAGCSSNTKPSAGGGASREDEFREVGGLIGLHTTKGKKVAPTSADLAGYEQAFPLAVKLVRSGEVVAIWGAKPAGEEDAKSAPPDIIAYEKKTPNEGGWVLLQNGDIKKMSSADFAAASKAK